VISASLVQLLGLTLPGVNVSTRSQTRMLGTVLHAHKNLSEDHAVELTHCTWPPLQVLRGTSTAACRASRPGPNLARSQSRRHGTPSATRILMLRRLVDVCALCQSRVHPLQRDTLCGNVALHTHCVARPALRRSSPVALGVLELCRAAWRPRHRRRVCGACPTSRAPSGPWRPMT
jgi:hypothetical protein